MVVSGQSERAGAKTDIQPAPTAGLGHCELRGEEERVAQTDVQDPNGYGDPLRPRSIASRRVGASQTAAGLGDAVTWSKHATKSNPASSAACHDRTSSSNDHPHCPGFTPIRIIQDDTAVSQADLRCSSAVHAAGPSVSLDLAGTEAS